MPIGLVNNEDFELELEKLSGVKRAPPVVQGEVVDIKSGRGPQKEVPEELRKLIAQSAIADGNKETKILTRALGISDSSLSAYKKGATSTASYNEPEEELKNHVNKTKNKITKEATRKLMSALGYITDEKLEAEDAATLASVARSMSAVIKDMEPEVAKVSQTQNNFILYKPLATLESSFDSVIVNE